MGLRRKRVATDAFLFPGLYSWSGDGAIDNKERQHSEGGPDWCWIAGDQEADLMQGGTETCMGMAGPAKARKKEHWAKNWVSASYVCMVVEVLAMNEIPCANRETEPSTRS